MANGTSFYSTSMHHYQQACREDPKLSTNDEKFQQRMKSMVQGIHSHGHEEGNSSTLILSFDIIKEATISIREINNLAVGEILAYKQDIGNAQILPMVKSYFELCKTTLDSLRELKVRLHCTINKLMAFRGGQPVNKKVRETVTFAEGAVDCFFLSLPGLIQKHVQVLHKLQLARDKEMPTRAGKAKNPTLRRVIMIMFCTVFAGAVIISILAATLHAPPILAVLSVAVINILSWRPFVKWVEGFWAISKETKGVATGEKRIIVIRELEDIKLLTVWNGDRAVVLKTMAELSKQIEKCYDEICMARRNILSKFA
ncbi:UPF0496 protein At2g18630-like [Nymphaea colorata]|uniref:UPF0496 protein At2g18630-like n=1 Tax=Nymphaea colorata TaxID=210225 RepID=UPI00129E7115|nr:UPF0496 protein At2g18630-like [Nymphaea colorata]XP_031481019.1 UPF0496 protein At2g18630-like [Nymphaea colorata]XP_031481020.1 UPF0496 protein At2g18630-like [Nymphaea colorata]